MSFNKIFIRILHFLGFHKNYQHIDDITLQISSVYDNIKDELVISDIKSQLTSKFNSDVNFKKRCESVQKVFICLPSKRMIKINYIEDTLFYPGVDNKALRRALKLKEIVNI